MKKVNEYINALHKKVDEIELNMHVLDSIQLNFEDIFNEIIIISSVFDIGDLKAHVTHILNKLMDISRKSNKKLNDFLDYDNLLMFVNIAYYYDRLPYVSQTMYQKIEKNIDNIDKLSLALFNVENRMFLSRSQKELYQNILDKNSFVFSAPTSYGKTTVMLNAIVNLLKNNQINNVLFLVPTKSLINEYRKRIANHFSDYTEVKIIDNPYSIISKRNVFLFTQERALVKMNIDASFSSLIDYIVVDESQSIAKVINKRSLLLLKVLRKFHHIDKIYLAPFVEGFSSNVLKKLDILSENSNEYVIHPNDSLVSNSKAIIDLSVSENKIIINNLDSESIEIDKEKYYKTDYSFTEASIEIYTTLIKTKKISGNNLFFIPNKNESINVAYHLEQITEISNKDVSNRMAALIRHLKENIHPQFNLIDMLRKGIAFHNSYLDDFTKRQIEYMLNETNEIDTLIATNTIAKGVNLSVSNLFTFIKSKITSELPELEFKNILGRSARLHINNQGHLFYVKLNSKNSKYIKLFMEDSPIDIEIKGLSTKSKEDIKNIKTNLNKMTFKNLLKDSDFSNSISINKVRDYVLENRLINIEDISRNQIDNMDFLIGIDGIAQIEEKIYAYGREKTIELINCWDNVDSIEKTISFLSLLYQWNKNVDSKYTDRMKHIRFLAVILYSLSHNKSIKDIVDFNLDRYRASKINIFVNEMLKRISFNNDSTYNGYVKMDLNNSEHVSILIINTLQDVQEIVEFELKRFLQDFYYRANKVHGLISDERTENFLEYTTIDPLKVKLISAGITDAFALNKFVKEPYKKIIENQEINLNQLLKLVEDYEGINSPYYYAIKDKI